MKKFGFTLMEILLTLGIIGIVSVLTLPNVMSNYNKRTQVTQLERFYNQIKNGVAEYKREQGTDDLSETDMMTSNSGVAEFMKNKLKVTRQCDITLQEENFTTPCFANEYKIIDKPSTLSLTFTQTDKNNPDLSCMILNTGASVCMYQTIAEKIPGLVYTQKPNERPKNNYIKAIGVVIDVNGKQAPNIIGRDLFSFYVFADSTIAGIYHVPIRRKVCTAEPEKNPMVANSCFDAIIGNNWEMNY